MDYPLPAGGDPDLEVKFECRDENRRRLGQPDMVDGPLIDDVDLLAFVDQADISP